MLNAITSRTLLAGSLSILLAGCGSGERDGVSEGKRTPTAEETRESSPPVPAQDPRLTDLAFLRTQPPSVSVEVAMGNTFLSKGELDSAFAHFRAATELDPDNAAAWNYVGICLGRMDRIEEAKDAYMKAIDIDAFYHKSHVNLGNIFQRQNKFEEAVREYKIANSIDTTDAKTWINLALTYEKLDDTNPAILAYVKATTCDTQDPFPWERLGWIYYDRKLLQGARDRWAEAVARDPSRDDLRENIRILQEYADSTGTR